MAPPHTASCLAPAVLVLQCVGSNNASFIQHSVSFTKVAGGCVVAGFRIDQINDDEEVNNWTAYSVPTELFHTVFDLELGRMNSQYGIEECYLTFHPHLNFDIVDITRDDWMENQHGFVATSDNITRCLQLFGQLRM